jgi:hypothetical protein
MTSSLLRRRLTPVIVPGALIAAYVQRQTATTSFVPQRTATI